VVISCDVHDGLHLGCSCRITPRRLVPPFTVDRVPMPVRQDGMLARMESGTIGAMRSRLEDLIDEQRAALHDSLDGLTEEEARRRLVHSPDHPARPGHARYLGRGGLVRRGDHPGAPARHAGLVVRPRTTDTIESVRARHREACAASREAVRECDRP
jgi:hypothetical protein